MIYDITHRTLFRYTEPVVHSQHLLHMAPREVAHQSVHHHSLIVEPAPSLRTEHVDAFGNTVVLLEIEMPHTELVVYARSTIESTPGQLPPFETTAAWDRLHALDVDVIQFACASRLTVAIKTLAERVFGDPAKADAWMSRANPGLSGQRPLDLLKDELGAAVVREMLERIDHGIFP